jgi:hypothetical protein
LKLRLLGTPHVMIGVLRVKTYCRSDQPGSSVHLSILDEGKAPLAERLDFPLPAFLRRIPHHPGGQSRF